jgi:hypothetical protein
MSAHRPGRLEGRGAVRCPGGAEGRQVCGWRASSIDVAFDSVLVALAQELMIDDTLEGSYDRFAHRVAECLRARYPAADGRELARCVLIARRACVRETLDAD